ncbi:positive regulator of sigma(E), RseC/MucC [Thiothrix caldifontis]|uniref:Positive regulator of sigma(E), RseC/MucC n=2 Tax=Thiothrix caldifontis TaxID=525918 RepID=A0A1H4CM13_9GAMM|nr:positive regulator of sigma(E), RseC/MucC [Thiothrix caldifontis]
MFADQKTDQIKFVSSSLPYANHTIANNEGNGMIEQTAVVVSVESGYAWILPQQKVGGCSGCATKTSCASSSSPFDFLRKEPQKMRVLNPSYARPGDTVVVGVQGDALLVYSLLSYLLPLLSLIVVAMLGRELLAMLGITNEWATVFSGLIGLFGGFQVANLVALRSFKSSDFQPVILRVVGQPAFSELTRIA